MKLRTKIFLLYLSLSLLPILILGIYSYHRFLSYTGNQIEGYSRALEENALKQINHTLDNLNHTLDLITVYSDYKNTSIIQILRDYTDDENARTLYERLQARKYGDSFFEDLLLAGDSIQGIYLFTPDGQLFSGSSNPESHFNYSHNSLKDEWYQTTLSLNSRYQISRSVDDSVFLDQNPSLYLSRSIYDIYSHRFLGTLLLDCDPTILDLSSLITLPDLALLTIENADTGEILYSNRNDLTDKTASYLDNQTSHGLNLQPLSLHLAFNYDRLYAQYLPTKIFLLVLITGLGLSQAVILYFVTRNLTLPVEKLSHIMSQQQKNGFQFVSPYLHRNDEIGVLYQEYRHMLEELDQHIKKEYRDRLILLDAQMKSLEARINSHFLFNTLESINSMAELSDNDAIATMSQSLGDMFRYAIRTQSEIVTLADELKHIDDYVSIQSLRFSGRFHLKKEIPPDLLTTPVLKLILQPLVENALYHGLNYCTSGDSITVRARALPRLLEIEISDNGQGMTAGTLEAIQSRLDEEAQFTELGHRSGQSIGLKNIHSRIRLYYGPPYGLHIESRPAEGTSITVRIPIPKADPHPFSGIHQEENHVSLSDH